MLAAVLEEGVNAFLGRHRPGPSPPWAVTAMCGARHFVGIGTGTTPARELTVGLGPVAVRVPRVAQVPEEVASQGFHSEVEQRYQRASQTTQRLFARLYLEGLATGDFEPVFRELVGETTALSANTVVRLKEHWGGEYEGVASTSPGGTPVRLHLGRRGLPGGGDREREDGALMCPWGPGGWGEGAAGDGGGLPGRARRVGLRYSGTCGTED